MEFVIELLSALQQQLQQIETSDDILAIAQEGFNATEAALLTLKSFIIGYTFKDNAEEIRFFKELKPQFYALMIYYVQVYHTETHKPAGAKKELRKYLKNRMRTITQFSYDNREFYKYVRSGATYLDHQYYIRNQYDIAIGFDIPYFDCDPRFSTSHDYKMALLLANEQLSQYFDSSLKALDDTRKAAGWLEDLGLGWAETKAALIEWIYALQSSGAIYNRKKNSPADVRDLASFFEQIFDIDLGNYYRTFQEIRIRKNRTTFLDRSRECLIRRMDESDMNPR
ncbi:RteC domain-containing protein [Mucilaginibacter sp. RS28]|uniref:RteC domain-containing protein n=1 Tax=Mucilaginibacter straminoryzae TaxID=2932774 RepID=A0A9X1WZZ5_9SPHI|nr:RteC domain-containing protein [Mucilaginibacter straminoryzae]MCJ8208101.1 RteC domain-containing protein [Mucilaginibacter straminoryzae]